MEANAHEQNSTVENIQICDTIQTTSPPQTTADVTGNDPSTDSASPMEVSDVSEGKLMQGQKSICGAHSRQTGKPCRRIPMANGRCPLHGGKTTPGRPETYELQSIFLEALDEEEEELFGVMRTDVLGQIEDDLKIMNVRMRRNMVDQKMWRDKIAEGQIYVVEGESNTEGIKDNKVVSYTETRRETILSRLERMEEAMTRMTEKKMRLLELKHKIEIGVGNSDDEAVAKYVLAMQKVRSAGHEELWK